MRNIALFKGTDEYDEGIAQLKNGSNTIWCYYKNGFINGNAGTSMNFTGTHMKAYVSGNYTIANALTSGYFRITYYGQTGTVVYKNAGENIITENWNAYHNMVTIMYCVADN